MFEAGKDPNKTVILLKAIQWSRVVWNKWSRRQRFRTAIRSIHVSRSLLRKEISRGIINELNELIYKSSLHSFLLLLKAKSVSLWTSLSAKRVRQSRTKMAIYLKQWWTIIVWKKRTMKNLRLKERRSISYLWREV
jgi:hypothetical protein